MYKLLIVEDNSIQIESLLVFVDWKELQIGEIQIAKNGLDGLEQFRKYAPDLIITDVCMPLMSGIEMAKEIREVNKDVQIIFISAHDDFEYAQKAIGYIACSYLLKPFSQAQLTENVNIALENIEKKREAKQLEVNFSDSLVAYREMLLHLLKNNGLASSHAFDEINSTLFFGDYSSFILFKVEFQIRNDENIDSPFTLLNSIKKQLFATYDGTGILETNDSLVFLVYKADAEQSDSFMEELTQTLENIISELTPPVESIKIGISEVFSDIHMIHKMYTQAKTALENQYIPVSTNIYAYDNLEDGGNSVSISEIKSNLETFIQDGDINGADEILNNFLPDTFHSTISLRTACFAFVSAVQSILIEYGMDINTILGADVWENVKNIETVSDPRQWIKTIITALYENVNEIPNSKYDKIISDIKAYINQNYANIHNIEQITSTFLISSSYAQQIFKQYTGQSIFEFLTLTRIHAAKDFLLDPYVKVYEVCEKIGYKKTSHFTELFKRYTGTTPQQYQRLHRKR